MVYNSYVHPHAFSKKPERVIFNVYCKYCKIRGFNVLQLKYKITSHERLRLLHSDFKHVHIYKDIYIHTHTIS